MDTTQVIFRYEVQLGPRFSINLPKGAQVLGVRVEFGMPHIYVLVDYHKMMGQPNEAHFFHCYRAAEAIIDDVDAKRFIGMFLPEGKNSPYFLFEGKVIASDESESEREIERDETSMSDPAQEMEEWERATTSDPAQSELHDVLQRVLDDAECFGWNTESIARVRALVASESESASED